MGELQHTGTRLKMCTYTDLGVLLCPCRQLCMTSPPAELCPKSSLVANSLAVLTVRTVFGLGLGLFLLLDS